MSMYPANWPKCPSCGEPALDGHITCGQAICDESGQRNRRNAVRMMRGAKTSANYTHGMGGLPRKIKTVKPVTLARLKFEDGET